ncbi:MAG: hypothetical protein M3Y87_31545, partial [Myxococcota bacterium]|nr:hypothetical protein [Myxococcota bacterium]
MTCSRSTASFALSFVLFVVGCNDRSETGTDGGDVRPFDASLADAGSTADAATADAATADAATADAATAD